MEKEEEDKTTKPVYYKIVEIPQCVQTAPSSPPGQIDFLNNRFTVITLRTESYGRWKCVDYFDPPDYNKPAEEDKLSSTNEYVEARHSSIAESIPVTEASLHESQISHKEAEYPNESISRRIEKAMDMVKEHLIRDVSREISKLFKTNQELERYDQNSLLEEIQALQALVPPELLAQHNQSKKRKESS